MHRRTTAILALACFVLSVAPVLHAQKSTERYIPIGKSPGVSYKYSYVGPIHAVDLEERTLTVKIDGEAHSVEVRDTTRIWLDRSGLRKTNLTGSPEDCKPGRTVEIMFADPKTKRIADWIKIRITETDG